MGLDRFTQAQADPNAGFDAAIGELKAGRKTGHWIWYVFPQLRGLGRSATAQFYGLDGVAEADAFLRDDVLRARLIAVTEVVAVRLESGESLVHLLGGTTDSLKLVSSLTLFEARAKVVAVRAGERLGRDLDRVSSLCGKVLAAASTQGFSRCEITLAECSRE